MINTKCPFIYQQNLMIYVFLVQYLIVKMFGSYEQIELLEKEPLQIVNTVSFNWDNSCIALATNKGFKILTTQPLKIKQHRDLGAPLQLVQMYDRTNLLAFVGFQNSAFVANRVAIFDDSLNNIIGDVSFESNIQAVKIRFNKMVVAIANKIYILDFYQLEIEHVIPTVKFSQEQPYNFISMSNDPQNLVLACPGLEHGKILLVFINEERQRRIRAHQSTLSNITLTLNGDKVATSSEKGTNIRIFNTSSGQMLQEFRRGNEYGVIYSLSFSRGGNWLSCTSDSNVVHVFASQPCPQQKERKYQNVTQVYKNPKSKLYLLRKFLPFFDAQYSYCQYKMPDFQVQMQSYACFGFHDDNLIIVNDYGSFKRVALNLKGGKCNELLQVNELLDLKL